MDPSFDILSHSHYKFDFNLRGLELENRTCGPDNISSRHTEKRQRNGKIQDYLDTKKARHLSDLHEPMDMAVDSSNIKKRTTSAWTPQNSSNNYEYMINMQDSHGNTQLHRAVQEGDITLASILLTNGANVNTPNFQGWAPLHVACNLTRMDIVELLLKYNATPNWATNTGQTPLHIIAMSMRYLKQGGTKWEAATKIFSLLVSKGGNVTAKDKNGKTPASIAGGQVIACAGTWRSGGVQSVTQQVRNNENLPPRQNGVEVCGDVPMGC